MMLDWGSLVGVLKLSDRYLVFIWCLCGAITIIFNLEIKANE